MTTHRTILRGTRLSRVAAEAWVPRTCFKHGPPDRIGIELELLVHHLHDPDRPTDGPEYEPLRDAARALPVDGTVTVEPGGQLEISSAPRDGLIPALTTTQHDLDTLRALAARHSARLEGRGHDRRPAGRRVLNEPRYEAMERYFDRWGPAGRAMMRRTASVQVNVEAAGPGEPFERRWDLLHAVGPALVAAFANSPGRSGPWAGWANARQAVWSQLDPGRTTAPTRRPGESLPEAWTRWCLDAPLMMVRHPQGAWVPPDRLSLGDWIEAGDGVVPGRSAPTLDDVRYHLTTLFPPVRARGHLEVRYVDAQPGDWWQVPVSVLFALINDPEAAARALAACTGTADRWLDAARCGLRDEQLAAAAGAVLAAASDALRAGPDTRAAAEVVDAYRAHWTDRGRSPGDDLVAGRPVPTAPRVTGPPTDPAPTDPAPTERGL